MIHWSLLFSPFSDSLFLSFNSIETMIDLFQHSGRGTVDRMEKKRTELHKFVDKSVDLMKSRVIKRQKEKIFLLQKQMYKVKEQLNSLHEANSTLKTALQDLETISLILVGILPHLLQRQSCLIYNKKMPACVNPSVRLVSNPKTIKASGPKLCMHTKGNPRWCMNEN